MIAQEVQVPIKLLCERRLTAADKLLWMVLKHDSTSSEIDERKLTSPTRLSRRTGLVRHTIYAAMSRLTQLGWLVESKVVDRASRMVNIPIAMFGRTELKPRDIVVYGLLKDRGIGKGTRYTYIALSLMFNFCVKTVRRAIQALVNAHWITKKQKNQLDKIEFRLDTPLKAECRTNTEWVRKFLHIKNYSGEAIAQAMVTSIIEPTDYELNASMSWLANPDTGMLLQADLWVPAYRLAMEFNGSQHYGPTSFCSAEESRKQQVRDAHKARMLKERSINLVTLRTEDLSIENIREKLQGLAPLRDLQGFEALTSLLDDAGRRYQAAAQRKKAAEAAAQR